MDRIVIMINSIIALVSEHLPDNVHLAFVNLMGIVRDLVIERMDDLTAANQQCERLIDQASELEDTLRDQGKHILDLECDKRAMQATLDEFAKGLDEKIGENVKLKKRYEDTAYEASALREANERLLGKLHQEEIACSKAHDDLGRLVKILMSNNKVFEEMVADLRLAEPQGYASKFVQICWNNDPLNRGKINARPAEILDFMHTCIKKHRSIDDNK